MSRGVARAYAQPGTEDPGHFVLLSIAKIAAPSGCTGADWHHYRIGQGRNVIDGYRSGTPSSVRAHVDLVILGLNERRMVKRGRVDLTTSERGRPPAAESTDA